MKQHMKEPTLGTFTAVWPVNDPTPQPDQLIAEAQHDLPTLAARHRTTITGTPKFAFRLGKNIRGSQGAKYVVTAEAPATQEPARPYRSTAA